MKPIIVRITKSRLQWLIDELEKPKDERSVLMLEKVDGSESVIIIGIEDDR